MDWDLKTPSWDETTLPNIETMEESNRFGVYRMKGDFSVDLKLGHNTHLTNSYSATESSLPMSKHAASASASVSKIAPSSSKKARAINNITMKVSCLVDGCNSDLSNCRDYHRRHKVCELHSKTPEVTISGLKQRFCQQCSRFHSLEQFDERKRSCRKRLDGHNRRRRRKPQAEPLMRPAASFLSSYQGNQLLPFSSSTAIVNPAWNGGVVTSCAGGRLQIHNQHHQQVHVIDKQDIFLGSTATSYGGEGKQLAYLQSDNPSTATTLNNNQTPHLSITTSVCQTVVRTSSLSENTGVRNKMLTSSSNSVQESPCALSLLSSSQTHTSGNGLNQMVQQPHSLSTLMQPLGLSLHGNSFESMVPNGTESDHCSSLYNIGSDGSQGNEAPQLFPFHHWE